MLTPEHIRQMAEAQTDFVWEAPAYERYERGPRWYGIMGLVALGLTAYAVWTANFLFAFLILFAAIILVLAGNEHPPRILFQVGRNGVVWNNEFLPFDEMHHFAIIYQPPDVKVLYIQPKGVFRPRMRVHLGSQDPLTLRDHLKQFVDEDLELEDEHATDMLARIFRI